MNEARLYAQAYTHHVAILGKTGSGKTYAAKGIVEGWLRAGRRVCVLDPTGAWWGLRASSDGKRDGFPIVVFGGDHADVPINEHSGAALGELVAGQNMPCIIDLSGTMLGERHRFVERFAESLFRANKGTPLHLIIDEADEFAPQSGPPGTERMLGAVDRIVRRGRIKGFRVMLISQRPAVLNKNVLTQANTLVAMRLPASQDRHAIEQWIKGQADEAKAAEVLGSLARLQMGEGWVWCPEHDILERLTFPKITTFDSSRTPDDGAPIPAPKRVADVDLSGIRQAMEAAVLEAKANDPESLRGEIRELRKKLAEAGDGRSHEHAAREAAMANTIKSAQATVSNLASTAEKCATAIRSTLDSMSASIFDCMSWMQSATTSSPTPTQSPRPVQKAPRPGTKRTPHQRIIDAIAWWESIGVMSPSRVQVGIVAEYTAAGGTFQRYVSALSSEGKIEYPDSGSLALTTQGRSEALRPDAPPTLDELHARVLGMIDVPLAKILGELLDRSGESIEREKLGAITGYEASGGTFQRYVSALSSLGLIVYPGRSLVAAAPILFPRGIS